MPRGGAWKGLNKFTWTMAEAKARIWPWLSYMCHVRSTEDTSWGERRAVSRRRRWKGMSVNGSNRRISSDGPTGGAICTTTGVRVSGVGFRVSGLWVGVGGVGFWGWSVGLRVEG